MPEALLSDENSAELYLSYLSSGALGALSWWLERRTPYSPEQMAATLGRIIATDLATLSRGRGGLAEEGKRLSTLLHA